MSNNLTSGPKIVIKEIVFQKIMHWVNKSNHEVSGLGMVKVQPDGSIHVIEAILLPQRNTAVTSDIEPEDVGKAMYEMRDADGEMKFYWHSHVNMGVFWSGTDADTIKKLSSGGWFVSTVFNKRREMKTCLSTVEPWPAIIDDVQTVILREIDGSLIQAWDADYKKYVTDVLPKPKPVTLPATKTTPIVGGPLSQFPFDDFSEEDDWPLGIPGRERGPDPDWVGIGLSSKKKKPQTKSSKKSIHDVTERSIDEMLEKRDALDQILMELDGELAQLSDAGLLTHSQEERFKS